MNEKLSMLYIPVAFRHLMLNARTSAWINQKGFTTFPTLTIRYIPKALRHYAECQDFSLGEQERIHNISLY